MTLHLAISPDVNTKNFADWFVFNTKIQRATGLPFRATVYSDFAELQEAFDKGQADLVFANAANTAMLVRDKGYVPLAVPSAVSNEAVIVVNNDNPAQSVPELGERVTVAATDAPDVERICRILLEPADLNRDSISLEYKPNPVLVAKALLNREVELGFFLADAYYELSRLIRRDLRVLMASKIYVVKHSLLMSPALAPEGEKLWTWLESLNNSPTDGSLLDAIGAPDGWDRLSQEDAEFMIDLMEALEQG
ncbi:PhnD/SsuA/transferrin family substrate-binding protein [Tessaracoccus sp. OH4464_COT-324]|uniref:PhnD/SsuA/transferrin family substrate-binding protein n=1 Tax=Tessaracoccus sp. OH4464_COT-324 TaxID=2491059 RepID=UPI000F63697F|nr:PhnD/SsuA/transferrin family substrate-binding protein [Tessaracoccus sp. OH4464_COT-324]RRD47990.1 hypothetical protein EII42_01740 [Tessaracoccus sp. OH4464_COT-324]